MSKLKLCLHNSQAAQHRSRASWSIQKEVWKNRLSENRKERRLSFTQNLASTDKNLLRDWPLRLVIPENVKSLYYKWFFYLFLYYNPQNIPPRLEHGTEYSRQTKLRCRWKWQICCTIGVHDFFQLNESNTLTRVDDILATDTLPASSPTYSLLPREFHFIAVIKHPLWSPVWRNLSGFCLLSNLISTITTWPLLHRKVNELSINNSQGI